jgi:hypothetical protein
MKTINIITFSILSLIVIIFTLIFVRDFALNVNFSPPIDSTIFRDWGGFIGGVMAFAAFIFAFSAFMAQQKSIKSNDLQNNFFRLIGQLQFIVEQINIQVPIKDDILITDKRDIVVYKIKDFDCDKYIGTGRNAIHILFLNIYSKLKKVKEDKYEETFGGFYKNYAYQLGHYFRFVYHIIKFIDESKIEQSEKQKYMDLLQAQLSTDEMSLIFYNAAIGEKSKKKKTGERYFQKLLDQYKILENIDDESVVKVADKQKYYPNTFK